MTGLLVVLAEVAAGDRGMGVGDTGDRTGRVGSRNTNVPAGRVLSVGLEENGLKGIEGAPVGPREKNWELAPGLGTDGLNTNGLTGVGLTDPGGKNPGRPGCGVTEF